MYNYSATNVGGGTWMVRRWKESPNDYTEAEIGNMPADATEKSVIAFAIEKNSWA